MTVANTMTIDVEDWFHILDAQGAPDRDQWDTLPSRLEQNMDIMLELLDRNGVRATMFWLGWAAERFPGLVRRCHEAGHEIASHGYNHLLAYKAGQSAFYEDIRSSKKLLEDLIGAEVLGFRVPGFSFTPETPWAYPALARAGYRYSSSIFPASRGHGGFVGAIPDKHTVETAEGPMVEFPITTVGTSSRRICLFGGGYLRITPWPMLLGITWLMNQLDHSIIYYLHPREVDPGQPRMKDIPLARYFKYYVNLKSTEGKMSRLLRLQRFVPMRDML